MGFLSNRPCRFLPKYRKTFFGLFWLKPPPADSQKNVFRVFGLIFLKFGLDVTKSARIIKNRLTRTDFFSVSTLVLVIVSVRSRDDAIRHVRVWVYCCCRSYDEHTSCMLCDDVLKNRGFYLTRRRLYTEDE